MYINLILGGVALFAVWLLLRKLLVKEDPPALAGRAGEVENAAKILEAELQKRQARDAAGGDGVFARMRGAAAEHLKPLAAALEDMRSSLPEESRGRLHWEDNEDSLLIHMTGTAQKADQSLRVAWRLPDVSLGDAEGSLSGGKGVYVLRDMHSKKEEAAENLTECVRRVAAFIADALA